MKSIRAERGEADRPSAEARARRARNSREGIGTLADLAGCIILTLTIMTAIFLGMAA